MDRANTLETEGLLGGTDESLGETDESTRHPEATPGHPDGTLGRDAPTRREFLTAGAGAAASAALLAGCTGFQSDDAAAQTAHEGDTSSYSVMMAPVGTVEFASVPENVAMYFPGYADMTVALGHGDALNSIGFKSRYFTDYYDHVDGASIDLDSLTQLYAKGGIDREIFLELDSDLHFIDPNWLTENGAFGLERSDIESLSQNVAPFMGNVIFRRTDPWHDYRYYSMYEAFEKVAQVFRERETYREFKSFHDAFIADVQASLPSAKHRPNGLLCYAASNEPETFSPYRLSGKGTNKKQFHDLGITDALADSGVEGLSTSERGTIDYGLVLEIDPDSILVRGHEDKSRAEFRDTVLAYMRDHEIASQLTAVKQGRVFRGGPIYEGPIQNLFLTERFARLYFPEHYSGELFDRAKVGEIVTGEA